MGQSLNLMTTHETVPEDVRDQIAPVDYTPCPAEKRQTNAEVCPTCESAFGWLCTSTNCNVCGLMFCTRCCPARYLLGDQPACRDCTAAAYALRRKQMLEEHLANAGVGTKATSKDPAPKRSS